MLLGDLDKMVNVHKNTDANGYTTYWLYTDDMEKSDCGHCLRGDCLQRVIFQANKDGTIDVSCYSVIHGVRKELN